MPDPLTIHWFADAWARDCVKRLTGTKGITNAHVEELYRGIYESQVTDLSFHTWATPAAYARQPAAFQARAERVIGNLTDRLANVAGFPGAGSLIDRVVFDASESFAKEYYATFTPGFRSLNGNARILDRELRFGWSFLQGAGVSTSLASAELAGQAAVLLHELHHASRFRREFDRAVQRGLSPDESFLAAKHEMGLEGANRKYRYDAEEFRAETKMLRQLKRLFPGLDSDLIALSLKYAADHAGPNGTGNARYFSLCARSRTESSNAKDVEATLNGNFRTEIASGKNFGGLLVGARLDLPKHDIVDCDLNSGETNNSLRLSVSVRRGDGNVECFESSCFLASIMKSAFQVVWPASFGLGRYLDGSECGLVSHTFDGWFVHPALEFGMAGMAAQFLECFPLRWNSERRIFAGNSAVDTIGKRQTEFTWDTGRLLYVELPQSVVFSEGVVLAEPIDRLGRRFEAMISSVSHQDIEKQMDAFDVGAVVLDTARNVGNHDQSRNTWRCASRCEDDAIRSSMGAFWWDSFLHILALLRWLRHNNWKPSQRILALVCEIEAFPLSWTDPLPWAEAMAKITGVGLFYEWETSQSDSDVQHRLCIVTRGAAFNRIHSRVYVDAEALTDHVAGVRNWNMHDLVILNRENGLAWQNAHEVAWFGMMTERLTQKMMLRGILEGRKLFRLLGLVAQVVYQRAWPKRRFAWQHPNVARSESVVDLDALNASKRDVLFAEMDRASLWRRPDPSTDKLTKVSAPADANLARSVICGRRSFGKGEVSGALGRMMANPPRSVGCRPHRLVAREVVRNLGSITINRLKCPTGIHRATNLFVEPFAKTFGIEGRPVAFSLPDIRRAFAIGGECNAQAIVTGAIGIAMGLNCRILYGGIVDSVSLDESVQFCWHAWAELDFDGMYIAMDDFSKGYRRLVHSCHRFSESTASFLPFDKGDELVAVISSSEERLQTAFDLKIREGDLLRRAEMNGLTKSKSRPLDGWMFDLLELIVDCSCIFCMDRHQSTGRVLRVFQSMCGVGFSPAHVDSILVSLFNGGPFGILIAKDISAAVLDDKKQLEWVESAKCNDGLAMANDCRRFDETYGPETLLVANEVRNWQRVLGKRRQRALEKSYFRE